MKYVCTLLTFFNQLICRHSPHQGKLQTYTLFSLGLFCHITSTTVLHSAVKSSYTVDVVEMKINSPQNWTVS